MKNTILFLGIYLILAIFLSCDPIMSDRSQSTEQITLESYKDIPSYETADFYKLKGFQVFDNHFFAVKLPVKISDLTRHSDMSHDFNYGSFINRGSRRNQVFYQVIINNMPREFAEMSSEMQDLFVEDMFNNLLPANKRKINYLDGHAYISNFMEGNNKGRGAMFVKNNRIYALTVITNNNLDNHFDAMLGGFKLLK